MKFFRHLQLLIFILVPACLNCMEKSPSTKIIAFQEKLDVLAAEFDTKKIDDVSAVKQIISSLFEFDQTVRREFLFVENDFLNPAVVAFVKKMDKQNTKQIKKILAIHGWTSISKFGKDTDKQMWLLVQHAYQDPFFQAGVAFLLEQLVLHGETEAKNFACLYDRVALEFQMLGLKQCYGTQISIKDDKVELEPVDGTLEEINKRRESIGLESVDEYLRNFIYNRQEYYKNFKT